MDLCDIFPEDSSCVKAAPEPIPADNSAANDVEEVVEEVEEEPVVVEDNDAGKSVEEVVTFADDDKVSQALKEGDYARAAMEAVSSWQSVKSLSTFAKMSPMMDHLTLVLVAGGWAASGAMMAFRYRSASNFYDSGKIGDDTNWWKLADQIRNFSSLGVGGILALTSLMASFDIANSINMMAWQYLGLGSMLAGLAILAIRFLGYDAAYNHSVGSDSAKASSGNSVMATIREDSIIDAIMEASSIIALASAKEGVAFSYWNKLDESAQDDMMADWESTIEERSKEIEAQRVADGLKDSKK